MQATDPDSSANLIYYMEGPKQAWDASGQDVPAGNYEVRGWGNTWARTFADIVSILLIFADVLS